MFLKHSCRQESYSRGYKNAAIGQSYSRGYENAAIGLLLRCLGRICKRGYKKRDFTL